MFDIDYLLINPLEEHLYSLKNIEYQVFFLFQLLEFDKNFKEYSDKISDHWYEMTEEQYPISGYTLSESDKIFIIEYAKEINNLSKVKKLINKLCNCKDGVLDYDDIMAEAENEISTIQNINNFDFTQILQSTSDNKNGTKHTSINTILAFKPNNK